MKRLLVALILLVPLSSSILCGQTISVSDQDWRMLLTAWENSKRQYESLKLEVASLMQSLERARQSQENSDKRIKSLEMLLEQALKERSRLEQLVNSLESQLESLGISLESTKSRAEQAAEQSIRRIEVLARGYERQLKVYKIGLWVVGVVAVGEATYFVVDYFLNQP